MIMREFQIWITDDHNRSPLHRPAPSRRKSAAAAFESA
jgi:hypothetical protein